MNVINEPPVVWNRFPTQKPEPKQEIIVRFNYVGSRVIEHTEFKTGYFVPTRPDFKFYRLMTHNDKRFILPAQFDWLPINN